MDISLLVCTYNRCGELKELLDSAVSQDTEGGFEYEVVVVDNNSSDRTRQVVHDLIERGHPNVRYLFEPRQGKGAALNTGLAALRGSYYAIADDDLLLPPDYLARIVATFRARADISFLGGKVLPRWSRPVPAWLTQDHWAAIALCDYGETSFEVSQDRQITLLAGAFRTDDVRAANGYHSELAVSPARIGGMEDVDLYERLFATGKRGVYLPQLMLFHKVEPERVEKRYHRRWHLEHGRTYAMMSHGTTEKGRFRLLGVPSYMYRGAATHAAKWCRSIAVGRFHDAFADECQLRFFLGFLKERRRGDAFVRG
jgi:glycosyltransferase involved in cell wall biosynthesis